MSIQEKSGLWFITIENKLIKFVFKIDTDVLTHEKLNELSASYLVKAENYSTQINQLLSNLAQDYITKQGYIDLQYKDDIEDWMHFGITIESSNIQQIHDEFHTTCECQPIDPITLNFLRQ